ncbi:hypothetical protein like AT5G67640 [Hibiscus trionum]|uniref:Uncharacterized protein n=1 Tax=Hibiscus trionum TaxID=183268 RepID=A0A9W7IY07_HIBTR|nr:hypothetical protein like AT5G67640 [Hibiscus trionum]
MRREEKRKRFHEAVLKTLYPPPSPPESEEEEENKQVITSESALNFGLENPDDFEESKSSSPKTDDEDDGIQAETQKLSRSQRKRLRKKKLKEHASRRGKIIGPLLPPSQCDGVGPLQGEPEGVRQNAPEEQVASRDKPDDPQGNCSSKKKLKQRRIAKRLAKEESNKTENSDRDKERQVI